AAGQLGRLGQAEPRRDGLHGELPGLQRVHADSNPDTGVSNFLSAPPWSRFCRFAAFETSCFDRYGKISQEIFEIVIVAGVYRLSVARASVYRPRANLCARPFVWSRLLPFARFGWLRKLAERGRSLRLLCYND
ncbi:hypothetical protein, partial [Rubneribacter badeniensis]|uniref:hypothetical protein n=1 Tax=Rubneribacter badeniensis TaxID=2070688 RepID=UPI003A91E575